MLNQGKMQTFERRVNNDGTVTFTFDFGRNVSHSESDAFIMQVLRRREISCLTEKEKILCQARKEHWPSILFLISKNDCKEDIKNLFDTFVYRNRWDTVKKMVNAGVHPDTPVSYNKTTLEILLHQRSALKPKESLELFEFFLDHGASPNFISKTLNFSIIHCICYRVHLEKFRLLLPFFTATLNRDNRLLFAIFEDPNYHKFRCLLVHGIKLDPKIIQDGLNQMMNKRKPNSPDYWRRNQHKRKIVADIKAWPLSMLIYCFQKRSVPVFCLA